MGLRCSLLGHVYGETTTERDREEQGGEVIVEERELEVCERCGREKVLSENTEVRTLQADPDEDTPDAAAPEPETAERSFSEPADSSVAGSEVDATSTASTPAEHAPSADEDDAVILEDEPGDARDSGQWPDEAQQEAMSETADTGEPEPEPTPWPDQAGEDEGFDAKPAPQEDTETVEFGGGLTPESADAGDSTDAGDEGYVEAPSTPDEGKPSKFDSAFDSTEPDSQDAASSAQPDSAASPQSDAHSSPQSGQQPPSSAQPAATDDESVVDPGFTSAGPVNPPTGSTDDADTLLVCPECGFERTAARASLRAGDICPECRKGYLAERR